MANNGKISVSLSVETRLPVRGSAMPDRWTKKQRRELRELQGLAWERELSAALEDLEGDLCSWRKGHISPFELNDRIHRFHNGRSRELFNTYSGSLDTFWLEAVVARGVIEESEVSEDLLAVYRPHIDRFRERLRCSEEGDSDEE
jgi:hypothetical protein